VCALVALAGWAGFALAGRPARGQGG
jgi:hypothetical protein